MWLVEAERVGWRGSQIKADRSSFSSIRIPEVVNAVSLLRLEVHEWKSVLRFLFWGRVFPVGCKGLRGGRDVGDQSITLGHNSARSSFVNFLKWTFGALEANR